MKTKVSLSLDEALLERVKAERWALRVPTVSATVELILAEHFHLVKLCRLGKACTCEYFDRCENWVYTGEIHGSVQ